MLVKFSVGRFWICPPPHFLASRGSEERETGYQVSILPTPFEWHFFQKVLQELNNI